MTNHKHDDTPEAPVTPIRPRPDPKDEPISAEELPPVATVKEIARFLRVRPNLVYAMHRRGEIPGGQRLGRSIRFSSPVVVKWLSEGESRPRGRRQ